MSQNACCLCGEPIPEPSEYHVACWRATRTGLTALAFDLAEYPWTPDGELDDTYDPPEACGHYVY